jgi:hypothetical protein
LCAGQSLNSDEDTRALAAQLFEEPAHTPVRNFRYERLRFECSRVRQLRSFLPHGTSMYRSLVATRVPQVLKVDGLKESTRYGRPHASLDP